MARKYAIFESRVKATLQAKTRAERKRRSNAAAVETTSSVQLRNCEQPDLVVVDRGINTIRPARRRTRKTSNEQLNRVMRSLQEYRQMAPILIDAEDRIIAGHVVWEAMRKLGADRIQCIVATHLDEAMLRSYAIAANRLGETGEWYLEELKIELEELQAIELNLELTAFTLPELDIIMSTSDDNVEPGEGGEQTLPSVARSGDLFILGDHRVLCADSLDPDSFATVMDRDLAQCVFSDPPYNCKIEGNVGGLGKHKHADFAMASGEMSRVEFEGFLATYLGLCCQWTSVGAVVFACMDWRQIDTLMSAGRSVNLAHINTAVWTKGGGMGGLYRSAHEFVAVFCHGAKPVTNNVTLGKHGRDRTNVWEYPGANRQGSSAAEALADHPTPKPVPLVADAIIDITKRGDIVLDPFLGSGSTLIACEKTNRVARCIELEGKYVDVAIRRWQRLTRKYAVHACSQLTFDELAEDRLAEEDDDSIDPEFEDDCGDGHREQLLIGQITTGKLLEPPPADPQGGA